MTDSIAPIRFGFLPYKWDLSFRSGKILTVREFDDGLKSLKKYLHEDGYFYPPMQKTITHDSKGKSRTIPKTKRPTHLFRLPASHELHVMFQPEPDIREGSAGFVIHLLAFLFGTRLQFADWFFDGRVPLTKATSILVENDASTPNGVLLSSFLQNLVCLARAREEAVHKHPIHVFEGMRL